MEERLMPQRVQMTHDHTPDANGWMPIETAPKDGTYILGWMKSDYELTKIDIWWWENHRNPIWTRWNSKSHYTENDQPTHWMPLPKDPVNL
jgi:hypothetical protein